MINKISIDVLRQLQRHLIQLNDAQYADPLLVFNGSSIGSHTRHILEFFECFVDGCKSGTVNYDLRKRNLKIELDLNYAIAKMEELTSFMENEGLVKGIEFVEVKFGANNFQIVPTNETRELIYLIEHSIHHFALIRIGIESEFKGIVLEDGFGIAYSTLENRKVLDLEKVD
jgi:hypothetical protein